MTIRRKYDNALQVGRYLLVWGLWDDGSLSIGHAATDTILWHWYPPTWIVNRCNRLAARCGRPS